MGSYDYYLSRYSFLVSQIEKFPKVRKFLTEKEVTRHCLKNFMDSEHTKPVTKVLERRAFSSKSFNKFGDMKTQLVSAIDRSEEKRQWLLKRKQERNYLPGFMDLEISENDHIIAKEEARQLRLKRRQQSVLTTGVRNGEPCCEKVPVCPENIAAKKFQQEIESGTVPNGINTKTDQNSVISRTMETNRETSDHKQVTSDIQDLVKARVGKQPLKPDDTIFETPNVQASNEYDVAIHTSLIFNPDDGEVHLGTTSDETPGTLSLTSPTNRFNAPLDHAWICLLQFIFNSYFHSVLGYIG
ncbi:unnamed protein product [Ambrosiozyma monospora]|uniref:Unnamed protein product n=1 Tax=Ambrosiozyma monospora TaxID=43982 RepID=A0ACB5T534_AMBMO|nr:unnamed protein product [Ambrosiozyma monospora]